MILEANWIMSPQIMSILPLIPTIRKSFLTMSAKLPAISSDFTRAGMFDNLKVKNSNFLRVI